MGSYGGHVLPGTFFILFGLWYSLKYAYCYLRCRPVGKSSVFQCCRVPCAGIVIEGVIKVVFVSIGILVEEFYPGAPMGRLHAPNGQFTNPMNWQHATMYFFFGLSGVADIISHTARHVVPAGFDRLFGGLALFIEGYLFFFHLHGRSHIDTRVHILLVLAVWPSALIASVQVVIMHKRKLLHVFEMLMTTLIIVQGTWFWQAAYILYPPHGKPWDPCIHTRMDENTSDLLSEHSENAEDCNALPEAELNLMFMTLFWSWHIAAAVCFVGALYFLVYQYLKRSGRLDSSFLQGYEDLGNGPKYYATGHLGNGSLLADEEDAF